MARKDAAGADVILAAGGLVWKDSARSRIALIHRPKYDDWTLPKGKLTDGESWLDGAIREVREETGFEVRPGDFAAGCVYLTRSGPKVVLYWHMQIDGEGRFEKSDEVDALEWMGVEEARRRLTHARERRVLAESVERTGG